MCGIVGFTGPQNTSKLKTMNSLIAHRGPDDSSHFEAPGINMAMRRLAIVDLSGGRQPVANEDDTIFVMFNGEIYNHKELRSDLQKQGHIFKTHHSDTETIVHLYEQYGCDWPIKANGMFAVAIWDAPKQTLFLFRDRLGKKPLYYSVIDQEIIFASEIKSILSCVDNSSCLDGISLLNYLSNKNTSAPRTIYSDIAQLEAGYSLSWSNHGFTIQPFWRADFSLLQNVPSFEEASEEIYRLLADSVRLRMDCDVPYGAYLSGGVDSSTVTALMSKIHSKPVKTFCLGYAEEAKGQFYGKSQDINFARDISKRLGTEHHEYIIDSNEFAASMPAILNSFDEPFSGTISTYFLSILIHQHVTVAISGDGSDELFGSYLAHRLAWPIQNFLNFSLEKQIDFKSLSAKDLALIAPFDTNQGYNFIKTIASSEQHEWRDKLSVFTIDEKRDLLTQEFQHDLLDSLQDKFYSRFSSEIKSLDYLNNVLQVDQVELLQNQILPFVDRLSMAHSIEVRCPFLDYRLVEFVNRLPSNYKIRPGEPGLSPIYKYILKHAVSGLLPDELIQRPKEGFVQPIYTWMHGNLKTWILDCLGSLPSHIFSSKYVNILKQRFISGDVQCNAKIWNLTCFALWWKGRGQNVCC